MPHLNEEDNHSYTSQELDSQLSPRASSTGSSSSLKRFEIPKFLTRKKHRPDIGSEESLDELGQMKVGKNRVQSLLASIVRPRSKSDAGVPRRRMQNEQKTSTPSITTDAHSNAGDANLCRQMSNLYSESPNAAQPRSSRVNDNIFKDMFRSRSHSEPKPRSRAAAIAARNMSLGKQVST